MYGLNKRIGFYFILALLSPGIASALTAQEIYAKVAGSVYLIKSSTVGKNTEYGSAVAVTDRILATNCHVALQGTGLLVNVGKDKLPGQLVYADRPHDICLVQVDGAHFNPVNLRPAASVNIGEEVYAIGNPDGLQRTISRGIISNRYMTRAGLILQTDAAISPGSSGGGLFDHEANLIGLTTSKASKAEGIGFVFPSELITAALAGKNTWQPEVVLAPQNDKPGELSPTYFGQDRVALVAKQQHCFLIVQGRDTAGTTVSLMLWDPSHPQSFLVFPSAANLPALEKILEQVSKIKQENLQLSKNYLVFNTVMYQLIGNPVSGHYLILYATVEINPENYLRGGQSLLVQFEDAAGTRGYKTVRFGLAGVPEALAAYDQQCR